jgi:hypothetical protein
MATSVAAWLLMSSVGLVVNGVVVNGKEQAASNRQIVIGISFRMETTLFLGNLRFGTFNLEEIRDTGVRASGQATDGLERR